MRLCQISRIPNELPRWRDAINASLPHSKGKVAWQRCVLSCKKIVVEVHILQSGNERLVRSGVLCPYPYQVDLAGGLLLCSGRTISLTLKILKYINILTNSF